MARAAKIIEKEPTTALVNWEEEMARQADVAAGMEANAGGGSFFSLQGGLLTFQDMPIPGNQMGAVILDHVLENVFYEGEFDPSNPTPPTCFAFGRDDATMSPHPTVVAAGQAQNETCRGCPMNEWGTADKGKGKACRNTRRLGIIPGGTVDVTSGRFAAFSDPEHFEQAAVGYLKIPVTSVKGFAGFVKQVAGALRRPPHGIFTRVKLQPDPKTQIRLTFEPLGNIPANLMGIVMKRHDEVASTIEFPYPLSFEQEEEKPKAKGKPAANKKPPVKRAAAGKKY